MRREEPAGAAHRLPARPGRPRPPAAPGRRAGNLAGGRLPAHPPPSNGRSPAPLVRGDGPPLPPELDPFPPHCGRLAAAGRLRGAMAGRGPGPDPARRVLPPAALHPPAQRQPVRPPAGRPPLRERSAGAHAAPPPLLPGGRPLLPGPASPASPDLRWPGNGQSVPVHGPCPVRLAGGGGRAHGARTQRAAGQPPGTAAHRHHLPPPGPGRPGPPHPLPRAGAAPPHPRAAGRLGLRPGADGPSALPRPLYPASGRRL